MTTNPKVDWFFNKKSKWQEEYAELRSLVLKTELVEELKWGCPCYVVAGNNVVLIHGFKDYCALLFMQGALLNDPTNLLIQQTPNVQAARQMRFTKLDDIVNQEVVILDFINEAIKNCKAGKKVELKETKEFKMPEEFAIVLNEMPDVKNAFENLTPGRQRAYLLYFSAPKQSKTTIARIEKCIPKILEGKGLDD